MQYHNNILCLLYDELVPVIIQSENTYNSLRGRGNITVHGYGGIGRTVLIEFESLPDKYRLAVRQQYGDPYEYASKQPVLNAIIPDHEALTYYSNYILPNGQQLPSTSTNLKGKPQINYVDRYVQNAEWLNMLGRLTADKLTLKKELNISIGAFWQSVSDLIKAKNVSLPANAKRLKGTLKKYQEVGYEGLIELHKFGNTNSSKVKDEVAEAFLKEMLSKNHDATIVAAGYNAWAKENGRKQLGAPAIAARNRKYKAELMLEQGGFGVVSSKLGKHLKRKRPSAPLLLVNSDDNVLDAYFRKDDNDWYRPVLYVVMDSFNDYILGYAWGDSVTKELVYEAFRNAHRNVMRLTGDAYCWQQLQTDRWGIEVRGKKTALHEYFDKLGGRYVPAAHKSAQSKYIERAFGTTWHQRLKLVFSNNYAGYNVGAKTKINRDNLDHRNFPDFSEAAGMIDGFVWAMRQSKRAGSELTREQEWVQSFNASDKAKNRLLSPMLRLDIFGKTHDHTNRISAGGLTPTLMGEEQCYELSQDQIYKHIGKKVQIKYDPFDLSQVLVSDGEGLRFVAQNYELLPSNFADYEPGDAERIKRLTEEKKALLPLVQGQIDNRKSVLERAQIDAASRLQAGVLLKEQNHDDQRLYAAGTNRNHAKSAELEGGVRAENDELEGGNDTSVKVVKPPMKAVKRNNSIYTRM